MIAQVTQDIYARWYDQACSGRPFFGCLLPVQRQLLGKASAGFFAGEHLAVDASGALVMAAGTADPEELASFLAFLDKHQYLTDGTVPAGWHEGQTVRLYTLPPENCLPLPPRPADAVWNENPSAFGVARLMFAESERQDDFYSELCTKRNHGMAQVYTLEADGKILSTAGAYALYDGQAYLACVKTRPDCRGRGLAGWLVIDTANRLARQGWQVVLLARPDRFSFYEKLGFVCQQELTIYTDRNETILD